MSRTKSARVEGVSFLEYRDPAGNALALLEVCDLAVEITVNRHRVAGLVTDRDMQRLSAWLAVRGVEL